MNSPFENIPFLQYRVHNGENNLAVAERIKIIVSQLDQWASAKTKAAIEVMLHIDCYDWADIESTEALQQVVALMIKQYDRWQEAKKTDKVAKQFNKLLARHVP